MSARSFPLQLTALSLTTGAMATTTAGCNVFSPDIVGEWSMTEIELNGEDYTDEFLGYSGTYEYDGCVYAYSYGRGLTLTVEKDEGELEADFSLTYTESYSNSCEPSENYSESYGEDYDTDIEKGDDGVWEIEIDDLDWKLECTIEDDEMTCEGDYDGIDIDIVFERG